MFIMGTQVLTKSILYIFILSQCVYTGSLSTWAIETNNKAEIERQINARNQQLQQINQQITEQQKKLEETQGQKQTLSTELKKVDSSIKQLDLGIQSSRVVIEKLGYEIEETQQDIQTAEQDIAQKEQAVADIMRQIQNKDSESVLLTMLKNKTLSEGLFEAQTLADLNKTLLERISELDQSKNELKTVLHKAATTKEQKEVEKQNLENKKVIASDLKEEKKKILEETKNKEKTYQEIASSLKEKQLEVGAEIDALEKELRKSLNQDQLPKERPGVLQCPVTIGCTVTQEYGATPFAQRAYKSKFHNGADFRAPIGTPIIAAADGTVFATGDNGRVQYGKFIALKHENGLATLYAHLSRIIVKNGAQVKRGDIIGYSGNTGYSTGPHLHFGVYWGPNLSMQMISGAGLVPIGPTVNPFNYL